jgi:hypothetical protein
MTDRSAKGCATQKRLTAALKRCATQKRSKAKNVPCPLFEGLTSAAEAGEAGTTDRSAEALRHPKTFQGQKCSKASRF